MFGGVVVCLFLEFNSKCLALVASILCVKTGKDQKHWPRGGVEVGWGGGVSVVAAETPLLRVVVTYK